MAHCSRLSLLLWQQWPGSARAPTCFVLCSVATVTRCVGLSCYELQRALARGVARTVAEALCARAPHSWAFFFLFGHMRDLVRKRLPKAALKVWLLRLLHLLTAWSAAMYE